MKYATVLDVYYQDVPIHNQYRSGYGRKIRTGYSVRIAESSRTLRVYVMIYGTSGSTYVIVNGKELFVKEEDILSVHSQAK